MHPAVREAREGDVEQILQLILELADYERSADAVRVDAGQLRTALFGPQPSAYALVAESEATVVGFALYFLNFSTWEGVPGIYLEDLFVRPGNRGTGLGLALMQALAEIAVQRGYARFEWSVLNWNEPSIAFYRRLGAVAMDGWTVYRLSGEALRRTGRPREPRLDCGDKTGHPDGQRPGGP